MKCGDCKHCSPIENVAGADCECKAKGEGFEVSQTDDINFYGERDNEPCSQFTSAGL